MDETTTLDADIATDATVAAAPVEHDPATDEVVEDELLIEEVSIDGMCGVY